MNNSYGIFARYYDILCADVDYKVRSDYISDFFIAEGLRQGHILDVACGTGGFSEQLIKKGYQVTGLDLSADMLTFAKAKCPSADFIQANMCSFDFNNRIDACICCLDSLNHLNSTEAWLKCFESVFSSLKQDGLFIFDVNTPYKHKNILANNTFIYDEDDFYLVWDNLIKEEDTVEIFLDFFLLRSDGNYERHCESFEETAYTSAQIRTLLSKFFTVQGVYDELTHNPERPDSERLYFVCKRK